MYVRLLLSNLFHIFFSISKYTLITYVVETYTSTSSTQVIFVFVLVFLASMNSTRHSHSYSSALSSLVSIHNYNHEWINQSVSRRFFHNSWTKQTRVLRVLWLRFRSTRPCGVLRFETTRRVHESNKTKELFYSSSEEYNTRVVHTHSCGSLLHM